MKNKKNHNKKIIAVCIALILCGLHSIFVKTDRSIESQVVKLQSHRGSCSGVQVKAPSGVSYILSAGHCVEISEDGQTIDIVREDGRVLSRKIIKEDPASDLLLIEGLPGDVGLGIGAGLSRGAAVRTFTHGLGLPTYQTSGTVIGESRTEAVISAIQDKDEEQECSSKPKNKVMESIFGALCVVSVQETAITAEIVPGSSGGPIVNIYGDVVGIASMTDGRFGYMVRLSDIRAFVANY